MIMIILEIKKPFYRGNASINCNQDLIKMGWLNMYDNVLAIELIVHVWF